MDRVRVLVVDDNPVSVELATFLLEEAGFDVDWLADGARLVEHVVRTRPQVVLMDMQLPGTDGLQLTAELKHDERTTSIPVIACTAYAMKGDAARMLAAGCADYIAKPIDVGTFAARVATVVARA